MIRGGSSNGINLESRTDGNPWRQLAYGYTGSENAGLTFGWTSNRVQGQAKTILNFTSTGNSDAANLESVSSYPLVFTTRRVNAVPSTPDAASIKPYWAINGSSKWEFRALTSDGTVHTIWTQP